MNFSEFCQPFYAPTKAACGLKGKTTQVAIPEFFMTAALPESMHTILALGDDTFRKWFKGTREPQPDIWAHLSDLDEKSFSREVSASINEESLPDIFRSFGIAIGAGEDYDKFAFASVLAGQLKAIAKGNGHA